MTHFVEIAGHYIPEILAAVVTAGILGLFAYAFRIWTNRPRLALDVTWRHVPASPNSAAAKEHEISNPESYLAKFTLTNSGESVIYLGRIETSDEDGSGTRVALSELLYNDAGEGLTKKAIGFPEALGPRQIFAFSHSFSRVEFQEMVARQHYLTVGSARPFKLKIHTKL